MQFARRFWECVFGEENDEFFYMLFSRFDKPVCTHGLAENGEYIRNACKECLEGRINQLQNAHSMIRIYCMRTYANRKDPRFSILLYLFSGEDLCVDIDFLNGRFTRFLLDCVKNDMLCDKTSSLMGTTIHFKHCRFDEEIDMLHNRGNLRLFLLFRFFLLESLRSRDPIQQRGIIYDLMVEHGLLKRETLKKTFVESYDHKKFTALCREGIFKLIE